MDWKKSNPTTWQKNKAGVIIAVVSIVTNDLEDYGIYGGIRVN